MEKKVVSAMMLTLLLVISMLTLVYNIQRVKASGTIYLRADGSIDPPTANITSVDNVTYTFTGNVYDEIVVERNSTVVDGSGYTLEGTRSGEGIELTGRNNVTVKNVRIIRFYFGIRLRKSSNCTICGNIITECTEGIDINDSSNNTISENNVKENSKWGIKLDDSPGNKISGNNITINAEEAVLIFGSSDNTTIIGNNVANNGEEGIWLSSANNFICGNDLAYNEGQGIWIESSSNNIIWRNNIEENWQGIELLWSSNYNSVFENNIANNGNGIRIVPPEPSHPPGADKPNYKLIYHNNFVNNGYQVYTYSWDHPEEEPPVNTWDDGYPAGGNYWSDYDGTDEYSGSGQDHLGRDGIGDKPYVIDEDNQDNYPLMNPWIPPEQELVVSVTAPDSLQLDDPSLLNAIVTNEGSNDEVDVELVLLINSTTADSAIIPLLLSCDSHTLSHVWTPVVEGTYNVTAYAHPVAGETSVENNHMSKFVNVSAQVTPPEAQVGVKAGDWIKCDYIVAGWPSETPYPEWLKVEIQNVEGTTATARVTMHMSDGTDQSDTMSVDVVAGGGTFDTLFGFVIPANCSTGDSITMGGDGLTFNVTIDGETTRTYAGASRTVVYTSFSQYGTELTYYWDKQTGVMVGASTTSGSMTATAKATETNMWQAQPYGLPTDPAIFYALIIVAIVIVATVAFFMIRRRKKLPKEIELPKS